MVSNYFYLELPNLAKYTHRDLKRCMKKLGRVVASGQGTESNPEALWIELSTKVSSIVDLREVLAKFDPESVRWIIVPVRKGEGASQARQIKLF